MTGPEGRPGDGFVLGVDLGTSHTVAMLRWPDGRTRPLLFDGQPLLPSAVYLDATGRLQVGRDALRLGQAEPGRFEPHPKRHIDQRTVLLGGAEVPVADLLAGLLGAVAREAVAATGLLPPAVLTHPAAWGEQRRAVLVEAITKAGWPRETVLLPEPVAAARYFAEVLRRPVPVGAALAVFDFGGGTLDVAVVRNDGLAPDGRPRFVVAASGGADDLGGLDLDAALVDHLGKSLAGAEPQAWQGLIEPVTLAQWRARRQFWEDVRGAKEMLSRAAFAPVAVPGVEHAVQLSRDEFEAVAGPLIRRGVHEAGAVIRAAGLTARELAGLFLVGGSSRVPMVARVLHSELGIAPIVLEQPELPVAEGAIIAGGVGDRPGSGAVAARSAAGGAGSGAAPAGPGSAGQGSTGQGSAGQVPAGQVPVSPATADLPATAAGVVLDDSSALDDRSVSSAAGSTQQHPGPVPLQAKPPSSDTSPQGGAVRDPWPVGVEASSAGPESRHAESRLAESPRAESPRAESPRAELPRAEFPRGEARRVEAGAGEPRRGASDSGGAHSGGAHLGEPHYGEPVDPWATGEAAAFGAVQGPAEPWLASAQPVSAGGIGGGDGASGSGGKAYKKWLVGLVVLGVVVAAGTVFFFWPRHPALDFHPLSGAKRVPAAAPMGSDFTATAVRGDRVYFASVDERVETSDVLAVVAADVATGAPKWSIPNVASAARWEQFLVTPDAVVAISARDSISSKRLMVLLDPASGREIWKTELGGDDNVMFTGHVLLQVDRAQHKLAAFDARTGRGLWERANPVGAYDLKTTAVIKSTTVDDDAGPASTTGTAFTAPLDDDTRIVQIGADRSAQVIDAASNKVLLTLSTVADPDDEVIAHNGRLIVAESGNVRRVVAYDLAKTGQPKVLYQAAQENTQLEHLTECGPDRVCFVETIGYKSPQVIAVDAAKGGKLWGRPLERVDTLVPVGDSVLAGQDSSTAQVSLLDADGKVTWNKPGEAARLDAANVLVFSKALSSGANQPSLSGVHLGDAQVELGPLDDQRSATCSWDTEVIACAGESDFAIQRFAG